MRPETADLMRIDREVRLARKKALERAYPLAKELAEILELEEFPEARDAKDLRIAIGWRLSNLP